MDKMTKVLAALGVVGYCTVTAAAAEMDAEAQMRINAALARAVAAEPNPNLLGGPRPPKPTVAMTSHPSPLATHRNLLMNFTFHLNMTTT